MKSFSPGRVWGRCTVDVAVSRNQRCLQPSWSAWRKKLPTRAQCANESTAGHCRRGARSDLPRASFAGTGFPPEQSLRALPHRYRMGVLRDQFRRQAHHIFIVGQRLPSAERCARDVWRRWREGPVAPIARKRRILQSRTDTDAPGAAVHCASAPASST